MQSPRACGFSVRRGLLPAQRCCPLKVSLHGSRARPLSYRVLIPLTVVISSQRTHLPVHLLEIFSRDLGRKLALRPWHGHPCWRPGSSTGVGLQGREKLLNAACAFWDFKQRSLETECENEASGVPWAFA